MKCEIKNGILTITVPVSADPDLSKSGKTRILASSHGNQATTASFNGKPVIVGFNAYVKAV